MISMSFLYTILAIFGLGILIFIHELGHYYVAKWVGMRVLAFSIGFGKPIVSWKRNGVEWRIGVVPFGGYVKIAGTEKEDGKEPHEIPDGFFGKKPIYRILVALAGPVVNIVFGFLLFCLIWSFGGREKGFSEYTKLIGWVYPDSSFHEEGIRPGDQIKEFDNTPFTSFLQFQYAAALGDTNGIIEGDLIDYETDEKSSFKTAFPKNAGIQSYGWLRPAQYLVYDETSSFVPSSSALQSGIEDKDRVIWADGELIFSNFQLKEVVNKSTVLLTVQRNNETFITAIPRTLLVDIRLSNKEKADIDDWKNEAALNEFLDDLYFIPYKLTSDNRVITPLVYIDKHLKEQQYTPEKRNPFSIVLVPNDQIIAVDGQETLTSSSLLRELQKDQVLIVVQRKPQEKPTLWTEADEEFSKGYDWQEVSALIKTIGTETTSSSGEYHLLKPIIPKSLINIAYDHPDSSIAHQIEDDLAKIKEMADPVKRELLLTQYNQQLQEKVLGLAFQSQLVIYNPAPWVSFFGVFEEISRTLGALVRGHLSPKFLAGPVGIVQAMQKSFGFGINEALFWLAMISINLAFLNLLPIPVLDGGHICFALYEMISRKRISTKTMQRLIIPFMILLIVFFIFATYNDILRLVTRFFE